MSCSLKLHKDNLESLDLISKFSTIKDKQKFLRYNQAVISGYTNKHGSISHLGFPFFVNYIGKGKEKVVFNKLFFESIDELENELFFKQNELSQNQLNSFETEIVNSFTDSGEKRFEVLVKNKKGEKLGSVTVLKEINSDIENNEVVESSLERDDLKGKGIGYTAYKAMAKEASSLEIEIYSSSESLSSDAEKVWKRLVSDGFAVKLEDINGNPEYTSAETFSRYKTIVKEPEDFNEVKVEIKEPRIFTDYEYHSLKLRRMANTVQREFNKFYDRTGMREIVDAGNLTQSFVEEVNISPMDALAKSIKKMNNVFGAVVIMDGSISTLGELLPADHPLSIEKGKPVILINPKIATSETVFHEFSHLYVDLLGGSSNELVAKAMNLLKDTKLYSDTQANYPELSEEMLNREVLAQAMGVEADVLFGKELVAMSSFSKILSKIYEMISNLFGINKSAVRELASQLINNNTQESPAAVYNTLITQKQKIKVDGTNKNEVVRAVEFFKENNSVTTELSDGSGRGYYIGKGSNRVLVNASTTGLLKTNRKLKSHSLKSKSHKGDIDLKFNKDDYSVENLKYKLNEHKIPEALDKALNVFLRSERKFDETTDNWHALLTRPVDIDGSEKENKNPSSLISNMSESEEDPGYSNSFEFISKNLEKILRMAALNQEEFDLPAVVGTFAHDGIEKFVLTGSWPNNITFTDDKFKNYIENLIKEGRENGSTFFTEVSIYSELNKLAGTIDLLEIKKDGSYVIHDYKTVQSLEYKGKRLSKEQLFVNKGYTAQLMIYGRILEEYGFIPSKTPYNIIAAKVDYYNLDVRETKDFRLSDLEVFSFEKGNKQQRKGIDARLYGIYNEVYETLRGRQLEIKGEKILYAGYKEIIKTTKENLQLYRNLKNRNAKNIDDASVEQMKTLLAQIEEGKVKAERERIRLSIEGIINLSVAQMAVLEQEEKDSGTSTFPSEYLRSFKHLLQLIDKVSKIKDEIELDTQNTLGLKDQEATLITLTALIGNADSSRKYYERQVTKHAVLQLSVNSYLKYADHKDKYQRMLKEKFPNKAERDIQIEKMLFENSDEIRSKEMEYWQSAFDNGILDISIIEHLFADPGINKSQVVQVVKNMIDVSDTAARLEIDNVVPDIVKMDKENAFNISGNTKEKYKEILEYREIVDLDGKKIKDLNNSLIPEFTSDNREYMFKYMTQREYYADLRAEISRKKIKTAKDNADLIKIAEKANELRDEYLKRKNKLEESKKRRGFKDASRVLRVNPEFTKLSDSKKKALRQMHEFLRMADNQIETNDYLKLTKYFHDEKNESKELSEGEYIYNLPKSRMTGIEAMQYADKFLARTKSSLRELKEQSVDSSGETISSIENPGDLDDEIYVKTDGESSDLNDQEVRDVAIRYRNSLGQDRDLQSFDIPTLLTMNYETATQYKHKKEIEPDLLIVMEAVKNAKIIKTDTISSEAIKGELKRNRISKDNLIHESIEHQINNRIYSQKYRGVHSKEGYRIVKSLEVVKSFTSIMTLSGNFMSALTTGGQGSIYRLMEGLVGEFYNLNDWRKGTVKANQDMLNVLQDTQKTFPTSKTMLMIKMLGLENHQKALANKFIAKNIVTKNLDQATLFAVTSATELLVTSTLMYSLCNNIRMMNSKGEYINSEGKVVDKTSAMTFDEAYTVVDGKLILNKHVSLTSRDLTDKFVDADGNVNLFALTNISNGVKSIYADMYGQYNESMKSYIEGNIYGAIVMNMKKWGPRGANRRFRGYTQVFKSGDDFKDFAEMAKDENFDRRFLSQDHQAYQEGYYVTTARFARIVLRDLKKSGGLVASWKATVKTMSEHEESNLKRGVYDIVQMTIMHAVGAMIGAVIASLKLEGGDDDKLTQERLYFLMYLAKRIEDESENFIKPWAMAKTITDAPVLVGSINKIASLLEQVIGISDTEDGGEEWNITQKYESGSKEGRNKAVEKTKSTFIPAYANINKLLGLTGISEDSAYTVEDSYDGYMRNR